MDSSLTNTNNEAGADTFYKLICHYVALSLGSMDSDAEIAAKSPKSVLNSPEIHKKIVTLTASKSATEGINDHATKSNKQIQLYIIPTAQYKIVCLQMTRSHTGLQANEQIDILATKIA